MFHVAKSLVFSLLYSVRKKDVIVSIDYNKFKIYNIETLETYLYFSLKYCLTVSGQMNKTNQFVWAVSV
jgi:hypothetical protein